MNSVSKLTSQRPRQSDFSCPVCDNTRADYIFHARDFRVLRCTGCTLSFSERISENFSNDDSSSQPSKTDDSFFRDVTQRREKDHASLIAALDERVKAGPVLLLSDADDEIVQILGSRGISFTRVFEPTLFDEQTAGQQFTAVVVSAAIMRVSNPRSILDKIRKLLPVGRPLILSTPLLDGRQARLMGRNWHEWHASNLWFYTRETLSLLLLAAGFERIWFHTVRRSYSLYHLIERLRFAHEGTQWFRILSKLQRILPKRLMSSKFPLPTGTTVVTASAASISTETVLSIVVPVFNEHSTFQALFDGLLAKQIPGIRKEIIVVESNSTDGSRELVRAYEYRPDVRVIYQPSPRGKGNAVREGLNAATGDILMIQDADLEYDLDDYEGLIAPLLGRQSMFILGSRHQGEWKIREFTDAPITAALFNLGHSVFRTMMNLAVNTKMADPFTMFKVFRREALFGLDFVCNRFDFDIELVIKLIRKGYTPRELPVNYVSRSFSEGKKVSVTRDGMTWMFTILRARFSPLGSGRV